MPIRAPRRAAAGRLLAASLVLLGSCAELPDAPAVEQAAHTYTVGPPAAWSIFGTAGANYIVGTDTVVRHGGARSATLVGTATTADKFIAVGQSLRPEVYAGRRVRLTGWVRARGATTPGGGAALWMRVDGGGESLAFDNMSDRAVTGTSDWRAMSVVLDVPAEAAGLIFGAILVGGGQAWYDDLRIESVGSDVPTTAPAITSRGDTVADARQRTQYARYPASATNLDFEGAESLVLNGNAVAWLRQVIVPFSRATAGGAYTDLAPLGAIVGDARVVGLGEGTHGTREFFQMKHRVLEYLVREKGFTAFAIEATMPESFAIDAYVRGGPGDPAVLLSNLYFWTWNTQEVLDMIQWMRAYNGSVAPDRQVRFFGFDMQSAGAAIDTVVAYMQRVDAPRLSSVTSAYACLAPYRNFGRRSSSAQYSTLPPAQRVVCRASVAFVDSMLLANRAAYEASGVAAYARARQSARLVVQWEDMRAQSVAGVGSSRRDQYMAENTLWLLDQLPAGSKMVLWAHNFHVSNGPASMGGHLRRALGPAYLIAGFTFGSGAFNAIEQSATGAFGALRAMSTSAHRVGSIESYFAALGVPRLMLDARRIPGASTATFLAGPMGMRSVGSVYRPGNDLAYFSTVLLPSDYDVLIHFGETSASTLLPFRYE